MKKALILLLVAICSFAVNTQAQIVVLQGTHSNTNGYDTISSTSGTITLTTPVNSLNAVGLSGNYILQVTGTIISNAFTTITCVLESSVDGVKWEKHFLTPGTDGINCDTLSAGTTTFNHIWTIKTAAVKTLQSAGVVINQWYSNAGRRLRFRVRLIPATANGSMQVYARMVTQN